MLAVAVRDQGGRRGRQLLEAERDPAPRGVDADHLDLHRLPDLEHVLRSLHVVPRELGDVEKASMPGMIWRNAPYFLVFVTWPSTIEPTGIDWTRRSHGSCCSWRSESEMRVCSGSSLITL